MLESIIGKSLAAVLATMTILSFNTAKAKEVDSKLKETKKIVQQYEENEKKLLEKYNNLKLDAEEKLEKANEIIEEKNSIISSLNKK